MGPAATAGVASTTRVAPVEAAEPRYRGMTFAHEGYDGVHGYGGSASAASLDSLARLGVDALAIVPYTFMRAPDSPAALPIPQRLGTETDSAVAAAIRMAHARGWRVLLKPQIWMRDSWPGAIDFATDVEWAAFLAHYRTWLLHYADLAAAHRVDALCVGTELTRATLEHPGFWRELIAEVRTRYSGRLTYAANWGEEFERITFWADLDAVGLDAYYPLSPKPDPTDAELLAGAQSWMQVADSVSARAGRPLWLTEVGYRSAARAWQNPHAGPAGRAADPVAQRRCYRALARAAAQSPRLTGLFVWKWPSYLDHGRTNDPTDAPRHWRQDASTEFAPADPESARVLRSIYRALGRASDSLARPASAPARPYR